MSSLEVSTNLTSSPNSNPISNTNRKPMFNLDPIIYDYTPTTLRKLQNISLLHKPLPLLGNHPTNTRFYDLTDDSIQLPDTISSVLGLGLNFIPTPRIHPSSYDRLMHHSLNELYNSLALSKQYSHLPNRNRLPKILRFTKGSRSSVRLPSDIISWFRSAHNSFKTPVFKLPKNLNSSQEQALSYLRSTNNIVVVEADKNLGPAILLKSDYVKFCLVHLENKQNYKELFSFNISDLRRLVKEFVSRTMYLTRELQYMISTLDFDIDKKTLPTFRILPKLHKLDHTGAWNKSTRPITSCRNSPLERLSKFVDYCISDFHDSRFTIIKSSDDLLFKLNSIPYDPRFKLATLDASALYPSIPLDHCFAVFVKILANYRYRTIVLEAIHILLNHSYVTFQGRIFAQITGLPMGTACAPKIANLFLWHYESNIISKTLSWEKTILYYFRYIDDMLLISRSDLIHSTIQEDIISALSVQPNISWNFEQEFSNSVNFLDLTISTSSTKFITQTYQKALNLYLYPAGSSCYPAHFIKGILKGLVLKYAKQNTLELDFKNLLTLLGNRFIARGHPFNLISSLIDFQKFANITNKPSLL